MRLLYKRNAWANASRCLQEQNFEAPFISNRISYHLNPARLNLSLLSVTFCYAPERPLASPTLTAC
jgi:hypothetical protein